MEMTGMATRARKAKAVAPAETAENDDEPITVATQLEELSARVHQQSLILALADQKCEASRVGRGTPNAAGRDRHPPFEGRQRRGTHVLHGRDGEERAASIEGGAGKRKPRGGEVGRHTLAVA